MEKGEHIPRDYDKSTGLYLNRENECFGTSLANLLIVQHNDRNIAAVVRDLILAEPTIFPGGGTIPTMWPSLVEFATGRNYVARLLTTKEYAGAYHELLKRLVSPMRYEFYRESFERKVENGKIVIAEQYGDGPCILDLTNPDGSGNHAIVKLPNGTFIDNGRIRHDVKPYVVSAALEIEKVKRK